MKMPKPPRERMFTAVFENNVRELKAALASGANINDRDEKGNTPLHDAIVIDKTGNGVFKAVLEAGADVDVRGASHEGSYTPLHTAARQNSLVCMQELIAKGSDVNACNSWGSTPLHAVCDFGAGVDLARTLIEAGAEVNVTNNQVSCDTPLHIAADSGKPELVRLLLLSGADTEEVDGWDLTPEERAVAKRASEPVLREFDAHRARLLNAQLEANTAGALARYAIDDHDPFTPTAADTERLERSLAGIADGEPIIRDQAPVRSRGMRL